MTATPTVFGPLRAASSAVPGHTKDWVAVALPDRLVIGYGRTGHRLRCTVVPPARCQQQDPHLEGQKRQHDKQAEGYQLVTGAPDPWVVAFLRQAGGLPSPQASATTTAAVDPPSDRGGLWWELLPTADLGATVQATLTTLESALATHLQARLVWDPRRQGDLPVEVDGEALTLPLQPPGRHGGCAHSLGAQTLLLLLHQRLPAGSLRLADAYGQALTPGAFLQAAGWLQDSRLRALAETLGLTLGPAVFAGLSSPRWFI
jgi:hypothetical protein